MEKVEAAGRSVARLAWLGAAAAVAVLALLWIEAERERRETAREAARAEAQDAADLLAASLQGAVDRNIQLMQGLVAVISFDPEIGQGRFARLAAQVLSAASEIRHIAAAPDLVIRRIYPLRGNHSVIGLDYRRHPEQLPSVELARDLGVTVLAGPVDLVQGGRGFVARSPVFIDDGLGGERRFWGIISTVIDPDRLYAAAGLDAPDLGLAVVLSGRDGLAGGAPFYGDPAILEEDPVAARVTLPHGAWEIAAIPEGGWKPPSPPWGLRATFALAALAIGAAIVGAGRAAQSRQRKVALIREREAELSRLSWRLELALAASQVGVWDVDLATDELIWDDRVRTLWGFPEREGYFSEADWAGRIHPDDRERALAEAREAVNRSGRFISEYRIVRPNGEIRHIRDMASVYVAPNGRRRLVGLLWDVTEDVERQEELDLRRREAEAATVAKSRFLAAMSHEIRTPMSGVLGLLGLMLEEPLPKRQRERAEIALASAQGLLQILNDILDFSKLETALIRLNEEEVAIRPLIDEVMALMAAGAAQKGIALRCEVADHVPERIVTDPMRLRQVLTNLLSNAAKFTEAGSISVRADYAPAAEGEGRLCVEVHDTGIGIASDQASHVFEQFVQIDNSLTRRIGGTGLGLAIAKQLVELMGGDISVTSTPGVGSIFRFAIRVRPSAAATTPAAGVEVRPDLAEALPPLRVLLAEDNATNQYLIGAFLQAGRHSLVTVTDGAAAVEAAAGGGFDVVLMDVQMPVLDGLAATRAIRALPGPAGRVPVIALTANAMSGDREQCMAAGMDDYLSKPVEAAALARALARVRGSARSAVRSRRVAGRG
jgi:signal transduction histidine kinase/ActR/RegA family two-component response regulator